MTVTLCLSGSASAFETTERDVPGTNMHQGPSVTGEPDLLALWAEVPDCACVPFDALSPSARAALSLQRGLHAFTCGGCGVLFVGENERRFCFCCVSERSRVRDRDRKRAARGTQRAPELCACGCGVVLAAKRATQRYSSAACRLRAHRARQVKTASDAVLERGTP